MRNLRRELARLTVRESSPTPLSAEDRRRMDRDPIILAGRTIEARCDKGNAETQRLSRELAHLYGRDVFCDMAIDRGCYLVEFHDGRRRRLDGEPGRNFLMRGEFKALAMGERAARIVLARDTGRPDAPPASFYAPEPQPLPPMPSLEQLLAAAGDE